MGAAGACLEEWIDNLDWLKFFVVWIAGKFSLQVYYILIVKVVYQKNCIPKKSFGIAPSTSIQQSRSTYMGPSIPDNVLCLMISMFSKCLWQIECVFTNLKLFCSKAFCHKFTVF